MSNDYFNTTECSYTLDLLSTQIHDFVLLKYHIVYIYALDNLKYILEPDGITLHVDVNIWENTSNKQIFALYTDYC